MIILAIRTDKPDAYIALYADSQKLAATTWQAHLELSKTLHKEIKKLLNKSSISLAEVQGIVCFKGPGSFTGLRIGLSVANALAFAQDIPIVGTNGADWQQKGVEGLLAGKNEKIAIPFYGSPPHITKPKK